MWHTHSHSWWRHLLAEEKPPGREVCRGLVHRARGQLPTLFALPCYRFPFFFFSVPSPLCSCPGTHQKLLAQPNSPRMVGQMLVPEGKLAEADRVFLEGIKTETCLWISCRQPDLQRLPLVSPGCNFPTRVH